MCAVAKGENMWKACVAIVVVFLVLIWTQRAASKKNRTRSVELAYDENGEIKVVVARDDDTA
jgi:hypothetical protein